MYKLQLIRILRFAAQRSCPTVENYSIRIESEYSFELTAVQYFFNFNLYLYKWQVIIIIIIDTRQSQYLIHISVCVGGVVVVVDDGIYWSRRDDVRSVDIRLLLLHLLLYFIFHQLSYQTWF